MSAIGNQPNLPPVLSSPVTSPLGPAAPGSAPATGRPAGSPGGSIQRPFSDLLREAEQGAATQEPQLRFSRHALARLQKRGITVDQSTLSRLNGAVARAAAKGSRDAVVLVGGAAFVVSIANRTVLTAVAPEQMRDQIFTNIDSAVIA